MAGSSFHGLTSALEDVGPPLSAFDAVFDDVRERGLADLMWEAHLGGPVAERRTESMHGLLPTEPSYEHRQRQVGERLVALARKDKFALGLNLDVDPKERRAYDFPYIHSWVMAHAGRLLNEYAESIEREPLIPACAPLDYVPRR